MPSSRFRRLGAKLLLLALALLISAFAAELLWRAIRPYAGRAVTVVFDPELGWKYRPGQNVRHRSQDFDVAVRIDGSGHRVAASQGRRASGGKPLAVFVGDSLTFGWGVEAEEAFPFLLRDRLGVEVVNLGVSGYGTDQSYLSLKLHGLPQKPALAVYTFCANDLSEVSANVRYGRPKPWFRQQDGSLVLSRPSDSATFLNRHSQLYHSLLSYLEGVRGTGVNQQEARQMVRLLVQSMAREARAASARLVVVSQGTPWLAETMQAEPGVVYVGLDEAFGRAARNGPALSFPHDPHWTPLTHRIVAEEIAAALGRVSQDQRAVPKRRV